jgi:heme oxygenase
MFSDHLKANTADAHLALERDMILHLRKIAGIGDYLRLLDFMHGYYEPLEERLHKFVDITLYQSHAANIRSDIFNLHPGFRLSPKRATELPDIDSPHKGTGVLYVLEGSTLGGQIITKMLTKQLHLDGTYGFSFYNPYGEGTMKKWQNFKATLNGGLTYDDQQAIIDGANDTFSSLKRWISLYE